jgi:HicA toxin of bacterial toxin-antitoxin,
VGKLNSKQEKVLKDIFKEPIKSDVLWKDIEKVLIALGAEISEGKGSRIRLYLNGVRAVFHRPHPKKQTDKGALKSMRRFLTEAGVKNVNI